MTKEKILKDIKLFLSKVYTKYKECFLNLDIKEKFFSIVLMLLMVYI